MSRLRFLSSNFVKWKDISMRKNPFFEIFQDFRTSGSKGRIYIYIELTDIISENICVESWTITDKTREVAGVGAKENGMSQVSMTGLLETMARVASVSSSAEQ